MTINATWHANNPMPQQATAERRLKWHLRHQAQCGCRPIPPGLRRAMAASGRRAAG
jgi:hypothetical protein